MPQPRPNSALLTDASGLQLRRAHGAAKRERYAALTIVIRDCYRPKMGAVTYFF
jgi:hypothetical protein